MAAPFVHPSAVVDESAVVGDDAKIWHFTHVSAQAHIGARSVLGQNVFVGRGVRVGAGVKVQNNVSLYEGVEVEDDVFLGPSCVFTNVNNPRAFVERRHEFRATRVCKGASVGANATIVCGVVLGPYCLVGAGAVVTSDVPAHVLVVGVPARPLGFVCRCGERLFDTQLAQCKACGTRYAITAGACHELT